MKNNIRLEFCFEGYDDQGTIYSYETAYLSEDSLIALKEALEKLNSSHEQNIKEKEGEACGLMRVTAFICAPHGDGHEEPCARRSAARPHRMRKAELAAERNTHNEDTK